MVAYSFNHVFVAQVVAGTKCQTIRAPRRRHARPGEPLQLYFGMRTSACWKLVTPDPVCRGIDEVVCELGADGITAVILGGHVLSDVEIEALSVADGFDPARIAPRDWPPKAGKVGKAWPPGTTARHLMGLWWIRTHGAGTFHGYLIRW